jgi:hypothetical protein
VEGPFIVNELYAFDLHSPVAEMVIRPNHTAHIDKQNVRIGQQQNTTK